MAPTILGAANAILAIPNAPGSGSAPITDFIILENGTDRMLTENNLDLMVRE
ncbi:MAG: hypothetical protein GY787_16380 [Alteromonadales bacterium]|jgi:hypothetical protein|nr:hypothetical protein [Alteromonadales bacterium]